MKKSIVILTIISLLIGMLPTVSFAATSYDPIRPSVEAYIGKADHPETFTDNSNRSYENGIKMYTDTTKTGSSNRSIAYYKFDLPEIPEGETVTSASLTLKYGVSYLAASQSPEREFRLYAVDSTTWDATTIEWSGQPLTMTTNSWPEAEPDAKSTRLSSTQNALNTVTIDISSMVREYYASDSTGDFSFAMMPYQSAKNAFTWIWPIAETDKCPTITLESDVITALDTTSVTPAAASDDAVVFEFNNPIDESTVSATDFSVTDLSGNAVTIEDGDFTVSDTTVTLSKTWDNYGFYQVSLSGISDKYGQALAGSRSTSFEISVAATTKKATALETFGIVSSAESCSVKTIVAKSPNYGKWKPTSNYILYKFDLSGIDKTKAVIGADFQWPMEYKSNRTYNVRQVPSGTWTDAETLSDALASDNYYSKVEEVFDSAANIVDTVSVSFGSETVYKSATADVSEAVSKTLRDNGADSEYITFAFGGGDSGTSGSFATNNNTTPANRPTLTVKLVDPSFDAVEASPAKGGTMNGVNEPIELNLATSIAPAYANTDFIKLVKIADNSEADVNINVKGSKLTITPVADLDERSEYKVVLKDGITDVYSNVLSGDKAIHRFTSGTALKFYEIKFTSDASPVYDETAEITSYNPGDSVTAVAKFENTSNTDLDAIMIIAIYGSDGSLIEVDAEGGEDCAPANQTTQFAKTISVPSNASETYIKAFIWSNLEDIRPICEDEIINQAR